MATTTSSNGSKTYVCTVKCEQQLDTYTVISPGGHKSLTLNTLLARRGGISLPELELVGQVRDAGHGSGRLTLTLAQMQSLVALRDKVSRMGAESSPAPGSTASTPRATTAAARATVEKVEARVAAHEHGRSAEAEVRAVERLQASVATLHGDLWTLEYDIPDDKLDFVANPSGWMWRFGFRRQLSCWVLPAKSLESGLVQEFIESCRQHGVTVDLFRTHPEELGIMQAIAHRRLAAEVRRMHASFLTKLENSCSTYEEARDALDASAKETPGLVSSRDYDVIERNRDNKNRGHLKKAASDIEMAIACARLFDASEEIEDLIKAFRAVAQAENSAFNARVRACGGKPSAARL